MHWVQRATQAALGIKVFMLSMFLFMGLGALFSFNARDQIFFSMMLMYVGLCIYIAVRLKGRDAPPILCVVGIALCLVPLRWLSQFAQAI